MSGGDKTCANCKHLEAEDEQDSDGYIIGGWIICTARDKVSNLKQFPFKNTSCTKHESLISNAPPSIYDAEFWEK